MESRWKYPEFNYVPPPSISPPSLPTIPPPSCHFPSPPALPLPGNTSLLEPFPSPCQCHLLLEKLVPPTCSTVSQMLSLPPPLSQRSGGLHMYVGHLEFCVSKGKDNVGSIRSFITKWETKFRTKIVYPLLKIVFTLLLLNVLRMILIIWQAWLPI